MFVYATRDNGMPVAINPQKVLYIQPSGDGNGSYVRLAGDIGLTLRENTTVIVNVISTETTRLAGIQVIQEGKDDAGSGKAKADN